MRQEDFEAYEKAAEHLKKCIEALDESSMGRCSDSVPPMLWECLKEIHSAGKRERVETPVFRGDMGKVQRLAEVLMYWA